MLLARAAVLGGGDAAWSEISSFRQLFGSGRTQSTSLRLSDGPPFAREILILSTI